MNTRIYYFSATGNCLAVAKRIAQEIGADLVPISSLALRERVHIEQERIGIVFPAYLTAVLGVPLIVEKFIQNIDNLGDVRVFAVCTCGGYPFANALFPLEKLRHLIRSCGGSLREEYSIRLPMNNLDYAHIPVPISSDIPKIIECAEQKTKRVAERILQGKRTRFPVLKWLVCRMIGLIFFAFQKMTMAVICDKAKEAYDEQKGVEYYMPRTDRSIEVRANCTGCGICANVCPAQNIVIKHGRPEFLHMCELCFACDEWCPTGAIQHWSRAEGIKYHYPTVHLSDMLLTDTTNRKGTKDT